MWIGGEVSPTLAGGDKALPLCDPAPFIKKSDGGKISVQSVDDET